MLLCTHEAKKYVGGQSYKILATTLGAPGADVEQCCNRGNDISMPIMVGDDMVDTKMVEWKYVDDRCCQDGKYLNEETTMKQVHALEREVAKKYFVNNQARAE